MISKSSASAGSASSASATMASMFSASLWAGKKKDSAGTRGRSEDMVATSGTAGL